MYPTVLLHQKGERKMQLDKTSLGQVQDLLDGETSAEHLVLHGHNLP